jgi:hypothetical protein
MIKLKIKNIKNDSSLYTLKIMQTFDIKETLNTKYMTDIMEFNDNDNLIGIVNYLYYPVLNYEKLFIRSIYYTDIKYLDNIIKEFIKIMKKKYNSIFTNINQGKFDKYTIDALKNNNFNGDEYFFLTY